MEQKNILIVDDEPHIVNLIRLSLDQKEFRVFGAYSAREAFEIIGLERPDLILVDIMMPNMDGFEFCRKLKEDKMMRKIPLVIVSAKAELRDKLQAIDVGAEDYITKPFDPAELDDRMKSVLRGD